MGLWLMWQSLSRDIIDHGVAWCDMMAAGMLCLSGFPDASLNGP